MSQTDQAAKLQARMETRIRIFTRRGWAPERAATFAKRLQARDEQRDDRRACIECASLMRTGGCQQAQHQAMPRTSSATSGAYMFTPITDTLVRCARFEWLTK